MKNNNLSIFLFSFEENKIKYGVNIQEMIMNMIKTGGTLRDYDLRLLNGYKEFVVGRLTLKFEQ